MSNTALKKHSLGAPLEFHQDVIDWFLGKRAGHLSKWLYSTPQFPGDKACGVDAWAKVAEQAKQGSTYYYCQTRRHLVISPRNLFGNSRMA